MPCKAGTPLQDQCRAAGPAKLTCDLWAGHDGHHETTITETWSRACCALPDGRCHTCPDITEPPPGGGDRG